MIENNSYYFIKKNVRFDQELLILRYIISVFIRYLLNILEKLHLESDMN